MSRTIRGQILRTAMVVSAVFTMALATPIVVFAASKYSSPATLAARALLNEAIVPVGAALVHPATAVVCQCAGSPGIGSFTTAHRYYVVPGSPVAIARFLKTHVPKGGTANGSGTSTSGSRVVISISIAFSANGPHLYLRQLAYSMTAKSATTSWLRIDSQISWVPSRSVAQTVTGAISATVTGYKSVALSGSMGDVKIKVVGRNLTTLIRRLNSLPIGPQANCMESLNGFSVDITLRNGAHVQVYNGFCAGPSDAVLSLAGHVNETRYTLYDRSCALIKDVVALFGSASVAGTRAALHTCETWTKNG